MPAGILRIHYRFSVLDTFISAHILQYIIRNLRGLVRTNIDGCTRISVEYILYQLLHRLAIDRFPISRIRQIGVIDYAKVNIWFIGIDTLHGL